MYCLTDKTFWVLFNSFLKSISFLVFILSFFSRSSMLCFKFSISSFNSKFSFLGSIIQISFFESLNNAFALTFDNFFSKLFNIVFFSVNSFCNSEYILVSFWYCFFNFSLNLDKLSFFKSFSSFNFEISFIPFICSPIKFLQSFKYSFIFLFFSFL